MIGGRARAVWAGADLAWGALPAVAMLKGIIPAEERTVTDLLEMREGWAASAGSRARAPTVSRIDTVRRMPPIVIGKRSGEHGWRERGRYGAGHQPAGRVDAAGLVPKYQRFQVVGIFHSGFYQYDSSFGFHAAGGCAAALRRARSDLGDLASRSTICTAPTRSGARSSRPRGQGFQTTNWMEQNRELFRALRWSRIVTFIVIGLIVCVAALNILIALTMMVMEKTRDIAVLMSFGVRAEQFGASF